MIDDARDTESDRHTGLAFSVGQATSALTRLLHAAAVAGSAIGEVYQCAHGIGDAAPERILSATLAPPAARRIQEIRRPAGLLISTRMTVTWRRLAHHPATACIGVAFGTRSRRQEDGEVTAQPGTAAGGRGGPPGPFGAAGG